MPDANASAVAGSPLMTHAARVPTAPLLTASDLMERLSISRSHAYDLLARGALEVVRVGSSVRVSEDSLADYLAARTTPALRSLR